jgi:DNA polymerase-3 subunit beta
VSFQFSPEGLTFVATDAHKLVKYARTDVKASQVADFIMPKKPLTILKNILLLQMLLKLNTTIRTLHFL